jgi:hypothetical protein
MKMAKKKWKESVEKKPERYYQSKLTIRHIFPEIEPPNEGQNETERQIDAPMVNSTAGPVRQMWMRAVDQGKHAMLLSILPPTSYPFELMLKMRNWGFNDCKIMLLPSM